MATCLDGFDTDILSSNLGVPQLFFRLSSYDLPLPASCADIYLRPEYI
jgi:hypothetical protein